MRLSVLHISIAILGLTSCVKERPLIMETSKEISFVVSISVPNNPATRSIPGLLLEDNRVDHIDIFLFDPVSGAWAGYAQASGSEIATDDYWLNIKRFTVLIPSGVYKALLVANASDLINSILNTSNGTYTDGGAAVTRLNIEDALKYQIDPGTKYNATPLTTGYRPFYMCSDWINLTIPIPETADYERNPIQLSRDVAKINLQLGSGVTGFTLSEIRLCNYNVKGYVVPEDGWWRSATPLYDAGAVRGAPTLESGMSLMNEVAYTAAAGEIALNKCIDEVFTFENRAGNLFLIVRANVTLNGTLYANRWYKFGFKTMNILRNYAYNLTITGVENSGHATAQAAYDGTAEGLVIEMEVHKEVPGLNYIVWGQSYYVATDKIQEYFYHSGGTEPLHLFTDYHAGWQGSVSSEGTGWLSISPTGKGVASATHPDEMAITALPNMGGVPREARIRITAGSLTQTITVTQFPEVKAVTDNLSQEAHPFVGAFWKANQWGERLIHISRPSTSGASVLDGAWVAAVLEGRDWIVLDGEMTQDPNVGWRTDVIPNEALVVNGNHAGFDAAYGVYSAATVVEGTVSNTSSQDKIYFRIGLKSPYTPTPVAPARYGVVLLWSKPFGLTQRIWVRQGGDPDYLMRPADGGTGLSGSPLRPDAVKFSPYNLTASTFQTSLPVQGGQFVAYPSQAGAFFQWANTPNPRYAYPPAGSVSGWQNNYPTDYWMGGSTPLNDVHETCPVGYSRPLDGIATAPNAAGLVAGSEFRQSLWRDPPADATYAVAPNMAGGYYADGFFDRRAIVASASGVAAAAVSSLNGEAGYTGLLFYNDSPTSYASLFFPLGGNRQNSAGALAQAGSQGHYWSGSSVDPAESWRMMMMSTPGLSAQMYGAVRSHGLSIRCVACTEVLNVTLSHSGAGTLPLGQSVLLTALSAPSTATNVRYMWEFLGDEGWVGLATTTAHTYTARVLIEGVNTYRVTALNGCGRAYSNLIAVTGTMSSIGVEPEPTMLMYVGAFWRGNQWGERVIHMPVGAANLENYGAWTATVSWMDDRWQPGTDGIVLMAGDSDDPNIRKSNPGNAENYLLSGNATMIMGDAPINGAITFRIGLKSKFNNDPAFDPVAPNYTTTFPARYAVVLVTYGTGKWRRIFIRQGEGADYVMRPSDPGAGLSSRLYAKRFSPYNVEDGQHRYWTSEPGNTNNTVYFAANSGAWVDYPSMGGYLFSFNASYFGAPPRNGSTAQPINQQWGVQGSANPFTLTQREVCPSGYRRPNDGNSWGLATGTATNSEIRHSLWSNPPSNQPPQQVSPSNSDNSVGGIYADGYYDRGMIENNGNVAPSGGIYTVRWNTGATPTPADLRVWLSASGRLFFNPTTHASLFFPAVGVSHATNQLLISGIGTLGAYWTSSAYAIAGNASYLHFSIWNMAGITPAIPFVRMDGEVGVAHMPVRCVAN